MKNIIEIIQKHSLTVRCLPHVVVSHWTYREGEKVESYTDGNGLLRKRSVVFLEKWNRKFIREEKIVKNGGWWYVKETKNTDSIIQFSRKYDKFFAPTLEGAIKLYLDSINCTDEV